MCGAPARRGEIQRAAVRRGLRPILAGRDAAAIAKLAANFRLRDKHRVGLITVDTYRIAAVEQLLDGLITIAVGATEVACATTYAVAQERPRRPQAAQTQTEQRGPEPGGVKGAYRAFGETPSALRTRLGAAVDFERAPNSACGVVSSARAILYSESIDGLARPFQDCASFRV